VNARPLYTTLLLVPVISLAQSNREFPEYAKAIQALDRGDCATAVKELTQFKKNAAAELAKNRAFAQLVDEHITKCSGPAGRGGGSTTMIGHGSQSTDGTAASGASSGASSGATTSGGRGGPSDSRPANDKDRSIQFRP
jgi:hypothetical protein